MLLKAEEIVLQFFCNMKGNSGVKVMLSKQTGMTGNCKVQE